MGFSLKKSIAGVCIAAGIVLMAVPAFNAIHGRYETNKLMEQFEQSLEGANGHERERQTEIDGETKEAEGIQTEGEAGDDEENAILLFGGQNVIGVIEIESLNIKYPVLEGTGKKQLDYAICHIPETADIGDAGNCVLCGHNGGRNGIFFTYLNRITLGDTVKVTDKEGMIHLYEAAQTKIISPYDGSVKERTGEEILILLTCAENGTKRFVCYCVPMEDDED